MSKTIHIIAAVDEEFGFGKEGGIPWHFPEDFNHFKTMTTGHTVIMGKSTYKDLTGYFKGKLFLPKRDCIVLTSDPELYIPYDNVVSATNLDDAIELARRDFTGDIFLIGGERVFDEGLDVVDCVHLTKIPGNYDCDRFFPFKKLRNKFDIHSDRESVNTQNLWFTVYVNRKWTSNI